MTAPPNGPYGPGGPSGPVDWPEPPSDDAEATEVLGPVGEPEDTVRFDAAGAGEATVRFGPAGEQGATVTLGPAGDRGATVLFHRVDEQGGTVRLGADGEHGGTVRLGATGEGGVTVRLGPDDEPGTTVPPGPADEHGTTVRRDPVDARPPSGEPASEDAGYSATVLASHWIQRPESGDTLVEESPTRPAAEPTRMLFTGPEPESYQGPGPTPPDRVEGTLLRFGPGVTPEVAHRTHRTLPAVPPVHVPRRRRLRRHALPALVLLCVLAFLAWQRLGPSVQVRSVAATVKPKVLGCDGTADIVGLVRTNGRPGTLSYRWIRSDGTSSGVLREVLVRDQRQARLHLLWTFQGKGRQEARAELRLLSPSRRTVSVPVTYDCR
ncbi:hypothetical protein [Streptomyces sp. NPDC057438]|uniref:hypothetical protein n=1 Tax=Streptomyces sp. NPDC057438 TaxID=3346133 RepID=UPI00369F674E